LTQNKDKEKSREHELSNVSSIVPSAKHIVTTLSERREQIKQILNLLENEEITLDIIFNVNPVPLILGRHGTKVATREAEKRYEKWFVKRGAELTKLAAEDQHRALHYRTYMEMLLRTVLGEYGLAGALGLPYYSLAGRITRIIHKEPPMFWIDSIEGTIEYWLRRHKTDPKITKVVALLTAKLAFEFFYRGV